MNVLAPSEIPQSIMGTGEKKAALPPARAFVLAVLAGVYIGFAGNLACVVTSDSARYVGYGISQLLGGAVFAVGLMLVILGGAELFTGNNMVLTMTALTGRVKWSRVLLSWALVYAGNLVGSLLLAWLVVVSGTWAAGGYSVGARLLAVACAKVGLGWKAAFARGVLCNWLVCLAVWLAAAAKDAAGKFVGIFMPVMAFVASGFEHSIANMYLVPVGIALSKVEPVIQAAGISAKLEKLSWGSFVFGNLLPVTLGNMLGGAFFVGVLYWFTYVGKPAATHLAPTSSSSSVTGASGQ